MRWPWRKRPDPGPPPVTLLPAAVVAVRRVAAANGLGGRFWVRVEVRWPRGAGAPRHELDVVTDPPGPADLEFESGGVRVVVPVGQLDAVRGATVDYGAGAAGVGFKVDNPRYDAGDPDLLRALGRLRER